MNAWTGFDFGDAWPYLAAGYGLFFVCIAIGAISLNWQKRKLEDKEKILRAIKESKGSS